MRTIYGPRYADTTDCARPSLLFHDPRPTFPLIHEILDDSRGKDVAHARRSEYTGTHTAQHESPRESEESIGLTSTDRMFALDSPYCSRQECCREKADARLRINTLRRTGSCRVLPPQSQELSGTSPSGSRRLFIQVKKILPGFRRKINME